MKKKVYDFILGENNEGVFAMSLVKRGAMQTSFIKLSEEEETKVTSIDEDKKIVTGIAMIPDKLIYRKDIDGEEAYIRFSKDTVREAAYGFISGNGSKVSTLEHEVNTEGVETIESWIVEDAENDKANALGLDVTVGCWILSQRITDDDLWDDVKNGEYNGFSIEGSFSKVELSKDNGKTNTLDDISNILNTIN